MSFPTNVLLAVDGSAQGTHALTHAASLVQSSGAVLHVVHVVLVSHWSAPAIMRDEQLDRLRDGGQEVLDAAMATLQGLGIDQASAHLKLGRVPDEVLRLRDELASDLIVIGSRGMNAFTRVLLGSDAESIMHHAPCPVLVVRHEEEK